MGSDSIGGGAAPGRGAPWFADPEGIAVPFGAPALEIREIHLPRRSSAHLIPITMESGPARCSTRVLRNPASRIQPAQSAPV